jgi:hypothetical protein
MASGWTVPRAKGTTQPIASRPPRPTRWSARSWSATTPSPDDEAEVLAVAIPTDPLEGQSAEEAAVHVVGDDQL